MRALCGQVSMPARLSYRPFLSESTQLHLETHCTFSRAMASLLLFWHRSCLPERRWGSGDEGADSLGKQKSVPVPECIVNGFYIHAPLISWV